MVRLMQREPGCRARVQSQGAEPGCRARMQSQDAEPGCRARVQGAEPSCKYRGARNLEKRLAKICTRISLSSEVMKLEYQRSELLIQFRKFRSPPNSYEPTYSTKAKTTPLNNESFDV